jgi:hypothetical protein
VKRLAAFLLSLALVSGALADTIMAAKTTDLRGALDDLALAAANRDYQIVKVQPLDNALVKRGFANPGVRLVFIGNAQVVAQAGDADPRLLEFLPIRLTLVQRGTEVTVMSDDLTPWKQAIDQGPGRALLDRIEADLVAILADFRTQ